MFDFGAETALITTEESWGHDITLIIDLENAPDGAPSEITGEITGFFRAYDGRAGISLEYQDGDSFHTVGIPVDLVTGYRLDEMPGQWEAAEEGRESFLEMVKGDLTWLMKEDAPGLSEACFTDCEETIATFADLQRMETWQRACPEIRRWYKDPEVFLVVGVAATFDLDEATRGERMLGALSDLNGVVGDTDVAAALARVSVDIEGLRLAARAVSYGGVHPMRGILFSLLAAGGAFGTETGAALAAIEEGFKDGYARRNRRGFFY